MAKGIRGSKRTARKPYHLMAKPTGFRCNIACDYCFYLEKEQGTLLPKNDQRVMDDQTLEAFIRTYIQSNPLDEIEFSWQGGEPCGFRRIRAVIPTTSAHPFRAIRAALMHCREAVDFCYQFWPVSSPILA
ncbi:hypothetical protein SAMN04488056_11946 [Cohaesibacter marisflavi]|uniref:Uncharacterized protein n=1 Tax=Cohaesibacter marisflavi TaxID=655353 RepID=A0A1I5M5K5_9HYPH|nr:hypothetical protein [Cohaesibacter marisflavi]SFP04800.1 hypothetical protein SAMN04488056_11946 [Cohaesibacter marisflavi]